MNGAKKSIETIKAAAPLAPFLCSIAARRAAGRREKVYRDD
jgi:hypothetical protein